MAEPVIRRRKNEGKEQEAKPAKREDTPVERWRPFDQYDKFREPGRSWRGDDPEIKRNSNPGRRSEAPLAEEAQQVASAGRYGDTMLAHITPREAALLKQLGGTGVINPNTGLPEFNEGAVGPDGTAGADQGQGTTDTSGHGISDAGLGGQTGGQIADMTPDDQQSLGFNPDNLNEQGWSPEEAGMYQGVPKDPGRFDRNNNWGLGIGEAQQLAGFGRGILGTIGYATEVGFAPTVAGINNSIGNLSFSDVAGFMAGMAVSSVVSPAVAGVLGGGIVGALGGRAAGSVAGNAVSNAVSGAISNNSVSSPTASAPAAAGGVTGPTTGGGQQGPTSQGEGTSGTDYRPATVQQQANPLDSQETITIDGIQFRRPSNSQTAGLTTNPGQFTLN